MLSPLLVLKSEGTVLAPKGFARGLVEGHDVLDVVAVELHDDGFLEGYG